MAVKKTALYKVHEELGAQIVKFTGYLMPLNYTSFKEEALTVRKSAGLFDISHMGRIEIYGKDAKKFLQKICTNDITKLKPGKALYTLICNKNGGTIDDVIVYQFHNPKSYFLVVNASNFRKDLNWLAVHGSQMMVGINDLTNDLQMIALQGPMSVKIMEKTGVKMGKLKYFHWKDAEILNGIWPLVSRTGYTGEDGFEIIVWKKDTVKIWRHLFEIGKDFGLKPAGLGARDVLRLEAGLPLYSHELSEEISPLEAGLEKFVSFEKGDFIGREVLLRQKNDGIKRKLIGFEVLGGRIARQGCQIFEGNQEIGAVASGNVSWQLKKSIGTGFVKIEFSNIGDLIEININGQGHQAKIVALPFYKKVRRTN